MTSRVIQVIIADDQPVVRTGLYTTLQTDVYIALVGMAKHFDDLLEQLAQVSVDVVVLDLRGMGNAPLSMVERMRREYPNIGVVIFSSNIDVAPELLQAGALGYVAKDEDADLLLVAIRAAANGQQYISPLVQNYLDRAMKTRQRQRFAPQEFNVLKLIASGFGTLEIAEELRIDPRTVQNYITSLRSKTGLNERTQLADFYRYSLKTNEE